MSSAKTIGAKLLRPSTVVAAALALAASSPAEAQTVKIGMILTYSGRDAALGEHVP